MNLKKIEKFIDKQKVSLICSIDNQGYPNVKAMLKPRKRNGLKELTNIAKNIKSIDIFCDVCYNTFILQVMGD